jgi:UDP-glucose 4-epimerase
MKNVVLFGASGFIGSEINKILVNSKLNVISVVNDNKKKFPKKFFKIKKKVNILKKIKIKAKNIDTVVHAATPNDILSKDFQQGMDLSLLGTKNILEFCVKNKVKNLIFFSTFQVYGTNLVGNIKEESKIVLNNFYALNHYFGEEICKYYSNIYKINLTVIRPSNVYGVPLLKSISRDTLVPLCFAKDLKRYQKIKLLSSGKQTRNFVSNSMIAKICKKLIQKFPSGYTILNISSNLNLSMQEIAKKMVDIANLKSKNQKFNLEIQSEYPQKKNSFKTIKSKLVKDIIPSKQKEKDNFFKVLNTIIEL